MPGRLAGGHVSVIDSPGFFNAPNGKTDPAAELEATLEAFFEEPAGEGEQHPQCAFVARYRWLDAALGFDPERLPRQPCPRFAAWHDAIDARGVTLVFPAAYLNNPSSMFGHTLLRLDRAGQDEQTRLVSYAINYGAETGADGGMAFALHGLTGGYRGTYAILPYYEMVKKYSDYENRDIWEYELDFEREEIERLVAHLWELREQYADYYFFDENCSYQLLFLLEAARPDLELTDGFDLYAIPVDTVRAVVEREDLLARAVFRPSSRTRIEQRLRALRGPEQDLVRRLADGAVAPDDPVLAALSPPARAAVLELAADFVTYRMRSGARPRDESAKLAWSLLAARSRIAADPALAPVPEPEVRPDQGHESARVGAGVGVRDGRLFGAFRFRPAYHALADPPGGYVEGAEIAFLDLELRQYEGEDLPTLEQLTVVGIRSLSERSRLIRPVSWELAGGLRRFRAEGEGVEGALVGTLSGGAGPTYALGDSASATLMGELEVGVGADCPRTCFAALGPTLAVVASPAERWQLVLDAEIQLLVSERVTERFAAGIGQSYALGRNLALEAGVEIEDEGSGPQTEVSTALNVYF